jgi:hypothetical protein
MTDPRQVLIQEFSSYYMADEIQSLIRGDLDPWIDASVRRLAYHYGDRANEVAALLQAAADDRSAPIVADLEAASVYDWSGTDGDWVVFQHIARGIARGLADRSAAAHGRDG